MVDPTAAQNFYISLLSRFRLKIIGLKIVFSISGSWLEICHRAAELGARKLGWPSRLFGLEEKKADDEEELSKFDGLKEWIEKVRGRKEKKDILWWYHLC